MKLSPAILNYVPKGGYYDTESQADEVITKTWEDFLTYDRLLFTLCLLLPGSAYSKGRMIHLLLFNPYDRKTLKPIPANQVNDLEKAIIIWSLRKEPMGQALRNLEMLTYMRGNKVNNARSRKIILKYIFDRATGSLDAMAVKYKNRLKVLVKHALGEIDTSKILDGRSREVRLRNKIVTWNKYAIEVIYFLFDKVNNPAVLSSTLPNCIKYMSLKHLAKTKNSIGFLDYAIKHKMGFEIILGLRNNYNLNVPLDEIHKIGKLSKKQEIRNVEAAKRVGVKKDIDYTKHELYDLWKLLFVELMKAGDTDKDLIEKLVYAIDEISGKKIDIGLENITFIMDCSGSMIGSPKRPLHPYLTALCLWSSIKGSESLWSANGLRLTSYKFGNYNPIIPYGPTRLWKSLIQAVELGSKTIIVISDGYENSIKGMFSKVYYELKKMYDFKLYHINPVFDSSTGDCRRLVTSIEPLMCDNYKNIKTSLIFKLISENKEEAKKMLMNMFHKEAISCQGF